MLENPNLFFFIAAVSIGSVFIVFFRVFFLSDRNLILNRDNLDADGNNTQKKLLEENEELRRECSRLRETIKQQKAEITADFQDSTFQDLQSLLTNYPSIRPMIEAKPNLPAKNLVSLLTPLDNLLENWGYEAIGQAWEQVSFNPQLHQADSDEIAEGDLVYIRFVGYRNGDKIICPAKVSRTLPGSNK